MRGSQLVESRRLRNIAPTIKYRFDPTENGFFCICQSFVQRISGRKATRKVWHNHTVSMPIVTWFYSNWITHDNLLNTSLLSNRMYCS